jgi:hypothetical protein
MRHILARPIHFDGLSTRTERIRVSLADQLKQVPSMNEQESIASMDRAARYYFNIVTWI